MLLIEPNILLPYIACIFFSKYDVRPFVFTQHHYANVSHLAGELSRKKCYNFWHFFWPNFKQKRLYYATLCSSFFSILKMYLPVCCWCCVALVGLSSKDRWDVVLFLPDSARVHTLATRWFYVCVFARVCVCVYICQRLKVCKFATTTTITLYAPTNVQRVGLQNFCRISLVLFLRWCCLGGTSTRKLY